jgi:ribose transport system substrate-binding protein
MTIMTDLLTAFPKIEAVWCINDPSALGAMLAISRRTGIKKCSWLVSMARRCRRAMKQPGAFLPLPLHRTRTIWHIMPSKLAGRYERKIPANKTELIPVKLITQDDVKADIVAGPANKGYLGSERRWWLFI